jgi:hypothetical protein
MKKRSTPYASSEPRPTPKSKAAILKEIAHLATQYNLTIADITKALSIQPVQSARTETLMKLFAYLGGIFIFSGLSIYIGTFWTTMNVAMKITITFGTGIILYLLALILPWYQKKYETMLTPLFLTATLFQTIGLFVAVNEFREGLNLKISSVLIFGVMLIQQLITFKKIKRASLIFTSLFFWCAFLATALDLVHASDKLVSIVVGLSVLSIAYALDKAFYKAIASFWYFVGAVLFLNGLFDALRSTYFEVLFAGISGLMLYLSTLIRNRTLLFVSTLSALGYIGYFTSKHFMHSAAWPILLVILGLVCFGVGIMVLKICKKYMVEPSS